MAETSLHGGMYAAKWRDGCQKTSKSEGRQLVTASGDYTIKLWGVESGREIRRFLGHSATVCSIALSPAGKHLLSGSLDGTARLWELDTGSEMAIFAGHSGPIYAVAFVADGVAITGGIDHTIRFWSAGGQPTALIPGAPD